MTPYPLPDGTVLDLDRPLLDDRCEGWTWDHEQVDPVVGPELSSLVHPEMHHMPLRRMAQLCGLFQLPVSTLHDLGVDPEDGLFAALAVAHPENIPSVPEVTA